MKISQGWLDIASFAKLIPLIIVMSLCFSIMPKVNVCTSTSHTVPCMCKLDVCHVSTEVIQKSIDTPCDLAGIYLSGPMHCIVVQNAASFTPSPLWIASQDYPPPEYAS